MNSSRPYLIRAIHEWLLDNALTPQLVVDAGAEALSVPREHVRDGRIVLNVSPDAVRDLVLGNELIEFDARFGGRPFHCVVPALAVLAVAARENGAGMSFPSETPDGGGSSPDPDGGGERSRPDLRLVK